MPVFKFTSPDGNEYYGEGADHATAFQNASEHDPSELAAMRTRQSVRHGAEPPNPEIPEAARAVQRGDYAPLREQAYESGKELFSYAAPVASMLGEALSPTATAAGGMFDAEPDKKRRAAWQSQYDEARGTAAKRHVLDAFNAEQSKIQDANRKQQEEERAVRTAERERTEGAQRRTDWETQNAEAIGRLPQTDRDNIKGAGSLPDAQSLFAQAMERRRQAGMTLAERYPASVLAEEGLAVAGDVYAPFRIASGRARALGEATQAARGALKDYKPGVARAPAGPMGEASAARNVLKEQADLKTVEPKELALGAAVPYIAGNIPNGIDLLMGSLSSDPAAKEKMQRAWESATDPIQFLRSIAVGTGATMAGTFAAGAKNDMGLRRADARGVLAEYEGRDAAAAEKAASAAARKKELADAKAEAARNRTGSREAAAAERERIANATLAKSTYANTAPKPLTPIQETSQAAEAAKAREAAEQRQIRALKRGRTAPEALKKGDQASILSPGGGSILA